MIFQKTVNNRFYASPSGAPAKPEPPPSIAPGSGGVQPPTGLPKLLSLTTQASSSIISVASGGGVGGAVAAPGAAVPGADSQAGVGVRPAGEYLHLASVAKPHADDILQFRIRPAAGVSAGAAAPAGGAAAAQDLHTQSQVPGSKSGHQGLRQAPSILRKRGTELAGAGNANSNSGRGGVGDAAGGASDASPRKRARKQQLQPDSASQLLAAAAAAAAAGVVGGVVESSPLSLQLSAAVPLASASVPSAAAASPAPTAANAASAAAAAAATLLFRPGHSSQPPPSDPGGARAHPANSTALPTAGQNQCPAPSVRLTRPIAAAASGPANTPGPIRLVKEELVLADADIALGSHENVGPDSPSCSPEDEQYRRMLRVLEEEPCRPQVFSRPRMCLLPPEQLCPAPAERGRARLGHFLRPSDVRRVAPSKRPGPVELGRSASGLADSRRACGLADSLDDLRASEECLAARLIAISRRLAPLGASPAAAAAAAMSLSPDKTTSSGGLAPLLQASAQPSRVLAELLARTRAMLLDLLSAHAPAAFVAMRSAVAAADASSAAAASAGSSSSSAAGTATAAIGLADDERTSSVASPTSSAMDSLTKTRSRRRRRRRTISTGPGEGSDAS